MPRFRIEEKNIQDGKVTISGDDYKHIVQVLRLREGDELQLFSVASEFRAVIEEINKKTVLLTVLDSFNVNRESALELILHQGILKSSKMELIIQKCTELGVSRLVPVINQRTQIRHTNKISRWRRIAEESCKQCGRNIPVEVTDPEELENLDFGGSERSLNITFDTKADLDLKNYIKTLETTPLSVNIFIGPEGGFSENERMFLGSREVKLLKLGPRILRAETAAITSVSIIQYLFGDL